MGMGRTCELRHHRRRRLLGNASDLKSTARSRPSISADLNRKQHYELRPLLTELKRGSTAETWS
ncbi:unnamed protein product [Prunus armeniaca]|uniref:Uncharacterized protein n=1 Tax=Prunus armeniaca TaxID=36596 RepID=A0A6J5WRP5_PRUAR|nr:unnamed protein product [Prunus armeniaca]